MPYLSRIFAIHCERYLIFSYIDTISYMWQHRSSVTVAHAVRQLLNQFSVCTDRRLHQHTHTNASANTLTTNTEQYTSRVHASIVSVARQRTLSHSQQCRNDATQVRQKVKRSIFAPTFRFDQRQCSLLFRKLDKKDTIQLTIIKTQQQLIQFSFFTVANCTLHKIINYFKQNKTNTINKT